MKKNLLIITLFVLCSCDSKTKESIITEIAKKHITNSELSPSSVIYQDETLSVQPFNHNGKGTKNPDMYNIRITYEAKNKYNVLVKKRGFVTIIYDGDDSLNPKSYSIKE